MATKLLYYKITHYEIYWYEISFHKQLREYPWASTNLQASFDRLGTRFSPWRFVKQKNPNFSVWVFNIFVGLLGLEPRLFWTKTRRVASYTIGQCLNADANLRQSFYRTNFFKKIFIKISIFFWKHIFSIHFQTLPKYSLFHCVCKAFSILLLNSPLQ